ncbi:MAG: alpha/beta hydrolase fold domain-containing protein [Gaiellales bacterium]
MDQQRDADVLPFPRAPEAVELRHLRSFVAVAEELNYTRASERLHLSRPALSRQISHLEHLVGVQLLRRTTHRVELTVAGEALLKQARALLGDIDAAIQTTQAVGGQLVGRVARLWDPIVDRFNAQAGVEATRAAFEAMHAQFNPPDGITTTPVVAGGVSSLMLAGEQEAPPSILFVHGGAHVLGSAFGFRHFAGAFAMAASSGVILPDYRLAPEHPFPADLDDVHASFQWLLNQGASPSETAIVAESSGAVLVLGLLLTCREAGTPMPGRVALLCPWLDLTWPYPYPSPNLERAIALMGKWRASYLNGHPIEDPLLDATLADLQGLPPMLVQAATGDGLLDDTRQLVEQATSSGLPVHLELYPTDVHGFQMFWSFLPEAADAIGRAAHFCRTGLPLTDESDTR